MAKGPYQIDKWDENYENYKSRDIDACRYVCVPNKQDGSSMTYILSLKDGATIYGIWHLILGTASRQARPRAGWMTDTGKPDGAPWTLAGMAVRWRRTETEVKRALEVLGSPSVGWIKYPSGIRSVPVQYPRSTRSVSVRYPRIEGKGREGNRKENG